MKSNEVRKLNGIQTANSLNYVEMIYAHFVKFNRSRDLLINICTFAVGILTPMHDHAVLIRWT